MKHHGKYFLTERLSINCTDKDITIKIDSHHSIDDIKKILARNHNTTPEKIETDYSFCIEDGAIYLNYNYSL